MNPQMKSPAFSFPLNSRFLFSLFLGTVIFAFSSCIANRMVPFDMTAFNKGAELKTAALDLMGMATANYADKLEEVDEFKTSMNEHIAYEEARGEKNKTTVDMWKLLMKSDGALLGGFLARWKNEGSLSQVFIDEIKGEVSANFDKIINLENKKKENPVN